jgi:DNA-binding NarL/FixJ family response regulator
VGQVGDGQAAVEATRRLRPDVVLLDIAMPNMSGLEALRQIKTELPDTQVVMLTVSDDDTSLRDAATFGASGYMLKNLTSDEFVALVDGLQRGEAALTRRTAARLLKGFAAPESRPSSKECGLTDREIEVLRLLARGLSNKAIAQEMCVSQNTVKYHVRNVMQQLGVQNRTEAVAYGIRAGLLDANPPP